MPPLDRRRRRRSGTSVLVIVVVAAVVLALLIGGALRIGRASGPYWQDVNRSYASQGRTLIEQSNQTGTQLTALMNHMTGITRRVLQQQLDSLTTASSQASEAGAAISPPAPSGALAEDFAGVLADRAEALARVRAAIDGLLGMVPHPANGGPTASTRPAAAFLPATQVEADITSAGALLVRADHAYSSVRHRFRSAPGRAALPRSIWVTDSQLWAPGPVQTLVEQLSGSSLLAPHHRVVLLSNGIRLSPGAVPPNANPAAPASANTATVPPTHTLAVTAVIANQGNVDEPKITVSAQVQPQGSATAASGSRAFALDAGGSVAVALPPFKVRPGDTYVLTVAVTPPAGQGDLTETSQSFTVKVAPAYVSSSTTAP